jgi:hypothetical protein
MYKMLCSYYGGEIIYRNTHPEYSRYTKQFLHYLFMFSTKWMAAEDDVDMARDYMELFRKEDT